MKKIIFLAVMIAFLSMTNNQSISAQEEVASGKQFYSELGGSGVLFSINFDSRFVPKSRLGFGGRIGAGFCIKNIRERVDYYDNGSLYVEQERITKTVYTIPVGINYVFGMPTSTNTLELGASATFLTRKVSLFYWDEPKQGNFVGHFTFMYRITPINEGFTFRIGFTPVLGTSGDLIPMGAVGFGYAF